MRARFLILAWFWLACAAQGAEISSAAELNRSLSFLSDRLLADIAKAREVEQAYARERLLEAAQLEFRLRCLQDRRAEGREGWTLWGKTPSLDDLRVIAENLSRLAAAEGGFERIEEQAWEREERWLERNTVIADYGGLAALGCVAECDYADAGESVSAAAAYGWYDAGWPWVIHIVPPAVRAYTPSPYYNDPALPFSWVDEDGMLHPAGGWPGRWNYLRPARRTGTATSLSFDSSGGLSLNGNRNGLSLSFGHGSSSGKNSWSVSYNSSSSGFANSSGFGLFVAGPVYSGARVAGYPYRYGYSSSLSRWNSLSTGAPVSAAAVKAAPGGLRISTSVLPAAPRVAGTGLPPTVPLRNYYNTYTAGRPGGLRRSASGSLLVAPGTVFVDELFGARSGGTR